MNDLAQQFLEEEMPIEQDLQSVVGSPRISKNTEAKDVVLEVGVKLIAFINPHSGGKMVFCLKNHSVKIYVV